MKVVLTKDVRDMGRAGSVHDVSDGHAINYLIPQKMAVFATPQAIKNADVHKQRVEDQKTLSAELIKERLSALSNGTITITKKANEKGHLYDAVDAKDIAETAQLPEDSIKLEKHIKEVGEYDVPAAYGDDFGTLKVIVSAE
jgi:large subunit ribosomal protein L9